MSDARHYARAYSLAGFKEHTISGILNASAIVQHIGQEMNLHIKYCEMWGISLEELTETVEAHGTLAYTRYVLERGLAGDRLDLRGKFKSDLYVSKWTCVSCLCC